MELESKIEGLLFYRGEEVSLKELSKLFNENTEEINKGLDKLEIHLKNRGITLVRKDDVVVLGVSQELSDLITSIRKEELDRELSKASLETLSIILYKNGISRSEIDYIRGVNSSFILRSLLVRGLIEKFINKKDSRKILYRPTTDTLMYMGVNKIEELPDFEEVVEKLRKTLIGTEQEKND